MHWLRAHTPLALTALAGILVLSGGFLMTRDTQTKTGDDSSSKWTGEDIFALPSSPSDAGNSPLRAIAEDYTQGFAPRETEGRFFPYSYSGSFRGDSAPGASAALGGSAAPTAQNSSYAQSASEEPEKTEGAGINSFFNDAYSLIPRGLISTVAPKPKVRAPEEKALYDYGNAVGADIQEFENSHKNAVLTLSDFFPKEGGYASGNPDSVNAVLQLAKDYSRLGNTVANMDPIPEEALVLHSALAQSYAEVGERLAAIANTKTDGDIMRAILAYNASAEKFIRNFVALAEFFSARGIKFSGSDSGNIFQFNR